MSRPNGEAAIFALQLRRAIDRRGVSLRGLGKLTDPSEPERGRRRVQRHLSGRTAPTAASRRVYAELLDAPELAPVSEDEEEDLDAALLRAIRSLQPSKVAALRRVLEMSA